MLDNRLLIFTGRMELSGYNSKGKFKYFCWEYIEPKLKFYNDKGKKLKKPTEECMVVIFEKIREIGQEFGYTIEEIKEKLDKVRLD